MTTPKQPQDHKPKKAKRSEAPGEDAPYTFTEDGETYTLAPFSDLPNGFFRANRRREALDLSYLIVEKLADEDTLEVMDGWSRKRFNDFQEDFARHNGFQLGES